MNKEIELLSEDELNSFIADVERSRNDKGNVMKETRKSNLYHRVKDVELRIKNYVQDNAGKSSFDPVYFASLNTEYFNLRFRYDSLNGKN